MATKAQMYAHRFARAVETARIVEARVRVPVVFEIPDGVQFCITDDGQVQICLGITDILMTPAVAERLASWLGYWFHDDAQEVIPDGPPEQTLPSFPMAGFQKEPE